jgi:gliding motility-associated-like protein
LRNLTTGTATGFQWEFGDGNISTEPDPLYRYAEPGVYRVILKAFLDGCIESASDEITVSEILVPNLITFNQDEKNETLQIGGLKPGWGLEIYNRWGKQLYRTDSYDNLWKPENLSEGSYYYLIRFPDGGYCRNWFQVAGK